MVDLTNVDPDVAYSSVPYEKGFALLFYLEQLLGGPGKQLAFSDFFVLRVIERIFNCCFCSVLSFPFIFYVAAKEICIVF